MSAAPAVLCVSGLKNSGKTALIEALIPLLAAEGVRTAVVKHHGHGFAGEIPDKPGSDTYRFFAAGALGTVIYDDGIFSLVKREGVHARDLISFFPDADLIIVEGAKDEAWPRIAMLRTGQALADISVGKAPLLCAVTDPDYDKAALPAGLPRFDFGDFGPVAALILDFLRPMPGAK